LKGPGINYVRRNEIQTAEPLLPQSIAFGVEGDIEKLKRHKSPDIDQIPAELITAGCRTIHSELHKPINSILKNEELRQWKELIILPVCKKGGETDLILIRHITFVKYIQNFI
jgi:hypothetical protein